MIQHFQWLLWVLVNSTLLLATMVLRLRHSLLMTSAKAYTIEQRLNNLFNNGGTINGPLVVTGNVTCDGTVQTNFISDLSNGTGNLQVATNMLTAGANMTVVNSCTVGGNLSGSGGTLAIGTTTTLAGNLTVGNDCDVAGNINCSKTTNTVTNFVRNGTPLTVP